MVFDVTDVNDVEYVTFENNRDFTADPTTPAAGDLGPECIIFIPNSETTHSNDIIAVANEVYGTISIFEIVDVTSVSSDLTGEQFTIYPNPTSGILNVSKTGNFEIYNFSGKLVKKVFQSNYMDVSDLAKGMHTIRSGAESMMFVVK